MLKSIALLPLFLLFVAAQDLGDNPLPVITEKVLVPSATDNWGSVAYPTQTLRAKRPRDPIHRPLPGPGRM